MRSEIQVVLRKGLSFVTAAASLLSAAGAFQEIAADTTADTLRFEFRPVTVTASRLESADLTLPMSVTALSESIIHLGQRQLVLNESLSTVPGLFVMNSENFAQDLRVSIRGFGARAAFGIRGVKIVMDGIPESTPDGQAQVDNVDLGFVQRVEVIRGPVSALYGNASGGVISLTSGDPPDSPLIEARVSGGDFGFGQLQVRAARQIGAFSTVINLSRNESEGFREHSAVRSTIFNTKVRWQVDPSFRVTLLANYADSPLADDPGALTRELVAENRQAARDRNVQYNAGESVRQTRVALAGEKKLSPYQRLQVRGYFTSRDFDNKLPFQSGGQVQLSRGFFGGGVTYLSSGLLFGIPYRLSAGLDLEDQRDERDRFDNLEGVRGEKVFDQLERFTSIGAFLEQEFSFSEALKVTAGGRYDDIEVRATDAYLEDGDDSGGRKFSALSPFLGAVYTVASNVNVYGNLTTSFETPTLNELSNDPEGGGGFNPELEPQLATNYEVGLKGVANHRFRYEVTLFRIDLTNELVPYELEQSPERAFYRNAGSSERRGMELGLTSLVARGLTGTVAYTFSDFTYGQFETANGSLEGKTLPGIPRQFGHGELSYVHRSGFFARLQARFTGELYADDLNKVKDQAYSIINVRVGYQTRLAGWLVEPFTGFNNLLDAQYNANVRLNAWGGRHFEPAPGRHLFGGVRVRVGK